MICPYCRTQKAEVIVNDILSRCMKCCRDIDMTRWSEVMINEKEALEYLDMSIKNWRKISQDEKHGFKDIAPYYVDAYQSVRNSLFGELLGRGEDEV